MQSIVYTLLFFYQFSQFCHVVWHVDHALFYVERPKTEDFKDSHDHVRHAKKRGKTKSHFANCNDKFLLKIHAPLYGPFDTFSYVEQ